MSKEIKEELKRLQKEYNELYEYVRKARYIEFEMEKLQRTCKHPEAYVYGKDTDEYECRSYDLIRCEDCNSTWETRSGRHDYLPKSPEDMFKDIGIYEKKLNTTFEAILDKFEKHSNKIDYKEKHLYKCVMFFIKKGYSIKEIRTKLENECINID